MWAGPSFFALSEAPFRTLGAFPFLHSRPTLPQKNTSLLNPSKTNGKSTILTSLGPAWGALGGLPGGPWGRLGAPRGLPKRCLEAPFVSWVRWKVSGTTLGPQGSPLPRTTVRWESILVLFRTHFGAFLFFVWCLLKPKQKTEETTTDQTLQLALKTENRNNGP